jgi:ATP-dependent DNA helicase RecG
LLINWIPAFAGMTLFWLNGQSRLMSLDEIANEHLKSINSSWDYQLDTRHDFGDISMEKVLGLITLVQNRL